MTAAILLYVVAPALIALGLTTVAGVLAHLNTRDRGLACLVECPTCGTALSVGSIHALRRLGGVPVWRVCRGCLDAEQAQLRADPEFDRFLEATRAVVPEQQEEPACQS